MRTWSTLLRTVDLGGIELHWLIGNKFGLVFLALPVGVADRNERLIELKKENFEIALYPRDPHGFVHAESWLDEYRRIYKLFEENLK